MINTIKKLRSLLSKRDKQFLLGLFLFSIVISIIETAGISVIMPFIAVATDFDLIHTSEYYSKVYNMFGFDNDVKFVITFGLVLISFYIFRSIINLLYFYMLNRFVQTRYHLLAYRLFENYMGLPYREFITRNSSTMTKSIVNDAKDSVQNFGSDAKDYVVNDSEKVTREIADDYTVGQEIGVRPSSIDKPTNSEIDDLKEVSGIGLKIEEVLNSLGIYHFTQISEWSPENIEWIENYLSIKRRVKKEDWIGQATLLASGGFTDFSKKVQRGENRNYD